MSTPIDITANNLSNETIVLYYGEEISVPQHILFKDLDSIKATLVSDHGYTVEQARDLTKNDAIYALRTLLNIGT